MNNEIKNEFIFDFQPEIDHITLIGIQGIQSSMRTDLSFLFNIYKKVAFNVFNYLRTNFPEKYKTGLHIYLGEYNDYLWIGFNHPGEFLTNIFIEYLENELPNEYFDIEETTRPMIPMGYSYYPNKILSFNTDHSNGESYIDEIYGTMLEITAADLFPDNMKNL